jgi:hypothetical protein
MNFICHHHTRLHYNRKKHLEMKCIGGVLAFVLCFGCASAASVATDAKVTPVQKVIQLMEGMLEKGKKEKHDEQVQFAAYKQFCDDTSVEKKRSIEEANERIEVLKADIQKYTADAALLTKEIAELDEDITIWKGAEHEPVYLRSCRDSTCIRCEREHP